MQNLLRRSLLIALSLSSLGCSLDSALFGVDEIVNVISGGTQGAEIVSGSTQFVTTTGTGYHVNATVGGVFDKVSEETTPNGYKVYISVQGQIIREAE